MTYTIPEAAIRAAGHALRTRAGVGKRWCFICIGRGHHEDDE